MMLSKLALPISTRTTGRSLTRRLRTGLRDMQAVRISPSTTVVAYIMRRMELKVHASTLVLDDDDTSIYDWSAFGSEYKLEDINIHIFALRSSFIANSV